MRAVRLTGFKIKQLFLKAILEDDVETLTYLLSKYKKMARNDNNDDEFINYIDTNNENANSNNENNVIKFRKPPTQHVIDVNESLESIRKSKRGTFIGQSDTTLYNYTFDTYKPNLPLSIAASMGSLKVIPVLITHGAKVNAYERYDEDNEGDNNAYVYTALKFAIKGGNDETAKLLLTYGAAYPPNDDDAFGYDDMLEDILTYSEGRRAPLIHTFSHVFGHREDFDMNKRYIYLALLDHIQKITNPVLFLSVAYENGININTVDEDGETVLFEFVSGMKRGETVEERVDSINKLVGMGADLSHRNHLGETAAARAIKRGLDARIIAALNQRRLSNKGAPTELPNIYRRSGKNYARTKTQRGGMAGLAFSRMKNMRNHRAKLKRGGRRTLKATKPL